MGPRAPKLFQGRHSHDPDAVRGVLSGLQIHGPRVWLAVFLRLYLAGYLCQGARFGLQCNLWRKRHADVWRDMEVEFVYGRDLISGLRDYASRSDDMVANIFDSLSSFRNYKRSYCFDNDFSLVVFLIE